MSAKLLQKSPDFVLIFLYLVLVFLGWLNLYSTDYSAELSIFHFNSGKQLIWIIVALITAFLLIFIDPLFFSTFAYGIYAFIVVLLMAVLIFGKNVNGARAWFEIFGARFQPAEFAKFATALALAKYVSSTNFQWNFKYLDNILIVLAILGLPVLLILLQPDLGSAIVYLAFLFPLYREGMPGFIVALIFWLILVAVLGLVFNVLLLFLIYFVIGGVLAYFFIEDKTITGYGMLIMVLTFLVIYVLALIFKVSTDALPVLVILSVFISGLIFLFFYLKKKIDKALIIWFFIFSSMVFTFSSDYFYSHFLKEHQQKRIDVLLGKIDDPKGVGYNLRQAKIAISSGGLLGKGYLKGTITKYEFVPEADTDFIFCTIGEEWGFLGAVTVILLFFMLIARIIYLAEKQVSKFSRFYAYSAAAIIFFHVSINIGMTVGLFPVIGIPLPFFSYGGSSLLGFTILIFIVVNLDIKRTIPF